MADNPIDAAYMVQMNAIAESLDEILNGRKKPSKDKQVGFVLLVFPFGDSEKSTNYISNGNRADVIAAMKHLLARFEGQPDIKGHA